MTAPHASPTRDTGVEGVRAAYPLPHLDFVKLEYLRTEGGEIKLHVKRENMRENKWVPVASPFGVLARLRVVDAGDAYGLRVVVQDMRGEPREVDVDRELLAKAGAGEIKAALFRAGLRVQEQGEAIAIQVLKAACPTTEIVVVSRPGWHRLDVAGAVNNSAERAGVAGGSVDDRGGLAGRSVDDRGDRDGSADDRGDLAVGSVDDRGGRADGSGDDRALRGLEGHDDEDHGGPIFVTPGGEVYGAPDGVRLELSANSKLPGRAARKGTFDGWKAAIRAAMAVSNCPHWMVGICAGFAGPVLSLTGLGSFGLNLSGLTSSGKTTAQRLAVSAWSSPSVQDGGLLRSLRTTENAVEGLAHASNGTILALDELSHADGHAIGRVIYGIAGGVGKERMRCDASLREPLTWSTFALLSGESSLREKVKGDGGSWQPGMAVRFPDVDVTAVNRDVDKTVLEEIDGIFDNFGHAGPAFIRELVNHRAHREADALRERVFGVAHRLAGEESDSALRRAAIPFAVLAVAGALAQEFGIIPKEFSIIEHITWAWNCFRDSSDSLVLDPMELAFTNIQTFVAERWDVTIKNVNHEVSTNNREAVAWYDEDAVYIPVKRICEAAGGVLTEREISRALDRNEMLARRQDARRIAVRYVPKIGTVDCYALKRSKFGHTNRVQPDLKVVGGDE